MLSNLAFVVVGAIGIARLASRCSSSWGWASSACRLYLRLRSVIRLPAIAASFEGNHSQLRRQQILRKSDSDILSVGTAMLAAKVGNQVSVLKYFARYWATVAKLVPADLAFPGRRTRGAADPFNQAINYVYGLLYGEVRKAVVHLGVDPYAGIMHGAERDQGSLIFDLIEEFPAPFGDRLILGMLGRGSRPLLGRHGDLRASVRRLIVNAFHRMWSRPIRWRGKMQAPHRILEQQTRDLAKAFLAEETSRPFQFRW